MSATNFYSIVNVVWEAKACERVRRTAEEVNHLPRMPVVSRKWAAEVDENGKRYLLARWARAAEVKEAPGADRQQCSTVKWSRRATKHAVEPGGQGIVAALPSSTFSVLTRRL